MNSYVIYAFFIVLIRALVFLGFTNSFCHEVVGSNTASGKTVEELSRLFCSDKLIFVHDLQFRDHASFAKYTFSIREFFVVERSQQEKIDHFIQSLRSKCDVLIGVHLRRGDYIDWCEGKYYYCNKEYLQVMKQLEGLFCGLKVMFFSCSNEPLDSREFSPVDIAYSTNQDPIEDMYLLAKCDYIVGPPSTFSGWASFYGLVPLYYIEDLNAPIALERFRCLEG